MQALAMLGAHLIRNGQKVLAHCGMGFNRSALLAGLILTELGVDGLTAVERLRERIEVTGGRVTIASAPGRGTTVTGVVPWPERRT